MTESNAKHSQDDVTEGTKAPQPGIANQEKDPTDWVTGGEPMTGAQASYLKTLCEQSGEEFSTGLSKADASKRIDALRNKTGVAEKSAAAK